MLNRASTAGLQTIALIKKQFLKQNKTLTMAIKLKPAGKVLIIVAVVAAGIVSVRWYQNRPKQVSQSLEVGKVALPDAPEASLAGNAVQLPLPANEPAVNGGTQITWERMAWNAQFSGMYANGGAHTSKGSLFDKAHLDIMYVRQDDCNKQCVDLVKFAQDYKTNSNMPGVLVTFMG